VPKYVFPKLRFVPVVDLRACRHPWSRSDQELDSVLGRNRGNHSRAPSSRKIGTEVGSPAVLFPFTPRLPISQNRFALPSGAVELSSAFLRLQELQLNKTLLTWMDFTEHLLLHLPELTNVELGYNRLNQLSDETTRRKPPTTDTKLSTVNFDGNHLDDWSEICSSLAKFPTCVLLPC
jgi:hypothetical protein